jgi:hypothetical protein
LIQGYHDIESIRLYHGCNPSSKALYHTMQWDMLWLFEIGSLEGISVIALFSILKSNRI